jgi:hypothetical protein
MEETRPVVHALDDGCVPARDQLGEESIGLRPAVRHAREARVLSRHADTGVSHHQDEEPRFALGEAEVHDRANPIFGC